MFLWYQILPYLQNSEWIHWQYSLKKGKTTWKNACLGISHLTVSDSETPVLVLSSTPSLLLFPGPLWPKMVIPVRILSMNQIDLFANDCYSMELCTKKNT